MEKFLEAAAIAWNPIGEVRKRVQAGTLTVGSVLVPFIGIVIACNLFSIGAQKFFWGSVLHAAGGHMPDSPLLTSEYAQRIMAAIGVLIPAGAVALLPERIFEPRGRNATIAAMLVVAAAWSFYAAAIGVPVYFFAGVLATVDLAAALNVLTLLGIPMTIAIVILALYFWFRIALSVLGLRGGQVTAISLVAVLAQALLVAFFIYIGTAST